MEDYQLNVSLAYKVLSAQEAHHAAHAAKIRPYAKMGKGMVRHQILL
jgi:hypothetical protein